MQMFIYGYLSLCLYLTAIGGGGEGGSVLAFD
jgi:hypothetical protein